LAIDPKDAVVDAMIYYFPMSILLCSDDELGKLYTRAQNIPKTNTKAILQNNCNGLMLDGILLTEGGRAEFIRAFRGSSLLVVKIPFEQEEAINELEAFEALGEYNPEDVSIIGPVQKVSLKRENRIDIEVALEMPLLSCSLSLLPRPVSNQLLEEVAQALLTSLDFVHSKGRVHGDVKISNILLHDRKFYLADFGSSAKIGGQLLSTTLSSLPDLSLGVDLKASVELDWFQGVLALAHLKNYITPDQRTNAGFLRDVLQNDGGNAVRTILSRLN